MWYCSALTDIEKNWFALICIDLYQSALAIPVKFHAEIIIYLIYAARKELLFYQGIIEQRIYSSIGHITLFTFLVLFILLTFYG